MLSWKAPTAVVGTETCAGGWITPKVCTGYFDNLVCVCVCSVGWDGRGGGWMFLCGFPLWLPGVCGVTQNPVSIHYGLAWWWRSSHNLWCIFGFTPAVICLLAMVIFDSAPQTFTRLCCPETSGAVLSESHGAQNGGTTRRRYFLTRIYLIGGSDTALWEGRDTHARTAAPSQVERKKKKKLDWKCTLSKANWCA